MTDPLTQLMLERTGTNLGPNQKTSTNSPLAGLGAAMGGTLNPSANLQQSLPDAGQFKPDLGPLKGIPWNPTPVTPSMPTQVPPAWKRWDTSQKMEDGYRNNWEPNPILTRLTQGANLGASKAGVLPSAGASTDTWRKL